MNRQGRGKIFDNHEKLQEMLNLWKTGLGMSELGRLYGVDHSSIYYQMKKYPEGIVTKKEYKNHKYEHLINEVRNEGKMYKQYLKAKA